MPTGRRPRRGALSRAALTAAALSGVLACAALVTGTMALTASPSAAATTASAVSGLSSARVADAPHPVTFTISSFNVLGASHTPPGSGYADGNMRIVHVHTLLRRHHVDVAGFQELQSSQLAKLKSLTDGSWAFYPGSSTTVRDSENSIGWNKSRFELVQATTVPIPYFDGHPRPMPLVLLRERATGMLAYVANYHNPATNPKHGNQDKWRAKAMGIEIALQKELYNRGIPRFVTGDMNDRDAFFCPFASQAPVIAARPGSYIGPQGTCHADHPRAVDWILGARKVSFSHYDEDRSHLVELTTDHPVISTDVTVDPARLPRAWGNAYPAPILPATWR